MLTKEETLHRSYIWLGVSRCGQPILNLLRLSVRAVSLSGGYGQIRNSALQSKSVFPQFSTLNFTLYTEICF